MCPALRVPEKVTSNPPSGPYQEELCVPSSPKQPHGKKAIGGWPAWSLAAAGRLLAAPDYVPLAAAGPSSLTLPHTQSIVCYRCQAHQVACWLGPTCGGSAGMEPQYRWTGGRPSLLKSRTQAQPWLQHSVADYTRPTPGDRHTTDKLTNRPRVRRLVDSRQPGWRRPDSATTGTAPTTSLPCAAAATSAPRRLTAICSSRPPPPLPPGSQAPCLLPPHLSLSGAWPPAGAAGWRLLPKAFSPQRGPAFLSTLGRGKLCARVLPAPEGSSMTL